MAVISENLKQYIQTAKTFIFGENNSRIDYVIENFYKLNHEKRAIIIISTIIFAVVVFVVSIILYFVGLFSLQGKLNSAYTNSNALKELKAPYAAVHMNFEQLTSSIRSANSSLSLIPLLEQKAKEIGVQVTGFPNKPITTKFSSSSPLSEQFQKLTVNYKLTNISLKKIIEYVNTLERLPNKLKVTKFRIISVTEAKLYFDVLLTVEAIVPSDKQNF